MPWPVRRLTVVTAAVAVATLGATAWGSATEAGPHLEAEPVEDLDPAGPTEVRVTGEGYDTSKGVYVAFCVLTPPDERPTPCGGGVDTTGASAASVWVADDPPPYAEGLTRPYAPGGSFEVALVVEPTIGEVDCRRTACGIVTRNDHLRTDDRSQDAAVPVTFADGASGELAGASSSAPWATGAAGLLTVTAVLLGMVWRARRQVRP